MQNPLLNIATQAARSASKIILQFFDRIDTLNIVEKEMNHLVSEVDLMAEREIIHHIEKAYPEHSIIAEEVGEKSGNNYTWFIDPLDGTANYLHGLPHFSISIAIAQDNQIEAALIYDPIRQELFTAAKGNGAFLDQKRIRVSHRKKLESTLIGTGFPFKKKQYIKPYLQSFEAIFESVSDIRRGGSAALDLAYVAAGRLDGFWETGLSQWDLAAGSLLIQEAGGAITDFEGKNNFITSGNVIASNLKIQKPLQKLIQEALKASDHA
jgi:myo-inositol-1(or 4)-monophosphatase